MAIHAPGASVGTIFLFWGLSGVKIGQKGSKKHQKYAKKGIFLNFLVPSP